MQLRPLQPEDLDQFFEHQQDPEANLMAAFTARNPADRGVFDHHWGSIANDPKVVVRTIESNGEVAGSILVFEHEDIPEITFWIARRFWGKGITTSAVDAFLAEYEARPLHARVPEDNIGSIKVLERRGFKVVDETAEFSHARAAVVKEYVMELN
ncbi:GNAT family N-acetyltransferase [Paeniglutamicibacter antarcticus]|uniref:GNAT family N-acetyltransferase n=1 Tax=Paeniglutamicibacter antarcticus TaxID=494023 RepID=UPI001AE28DA3